MEEKRLVMIEQDDYMAYFKLNKSQYDLLLYLCTNGYLNENAYVNFDAKIDIIEI